MFTRNDLRILLIEARCDPKMVAHEVKCLVKSGHIAPEQITPMSILPHGPKISDLEGYHACILGGTGDYSVVNDHPEFYQPLLDFTRHLLEVGLPTLGLCYGHQIIAQACKGTVETNHELSETGTFEIHLTEEGKKDLILRQLPDKFMAQQGHHDMVTSMPKEFVRLAENANCKWQGMRHSVKPMYSVQFHPELSRADLVERMVTYADVYASEPGKLEAICDAIKETNCQSVIEKFIDEVAVPHWNK